MTALGSQPTITALDPYTAVVSGPPFTLQVEGSGYVNETQVLWNGNALPTTFVDSSHLTATVGAAQLAAAGNVQVTAQAAGGFASNAETFAVAAPAPAISSLSPAAVMVGSGAQTLVVDGSNFSAGAQVLWNGDPLPAEVLSPTRVRAQLPAALLVDAQTVGVSVRNGAPDERISAVVPFAVEENHPLYLPLMMR